ncbi:hypothetical protein [uncultured Parabacteroides sp.]|nr:hypothetical protein [uncultured Parabacteroides sp.]
MKCAVFSNENGRHCHDDRFRIGGGRHLVSTTTVLMAMKTVVVETGCRNL